MGHIRGLQGMLSVPLASNTHRTAVEAAWFAAALLFETFIFLSLSFHQTLRNFRADYRPGLMNIITILFLHNKENLVIINPQKPVYLFT